MNAGLWVLAAIGAVAVVGFLASAGFVAVCMYFDRRNDGN